MLETSQSIQMSAFRLLARECCSVLTFCKLKQGMSDDLITDFNLTDFTCVGLSVSTANDLEEILMEGKNWLMCSAGHR